MLLLTFGSVVAMGLPIVTALFGLGTGLGVIALFTHVVDTPNFSSELAAMIGLGVGIDYALFILTRFREAYATPGPTFENPRESVVQAMDTAGRAVLFAGCTVVIALLGMMLLGVSFLYGVAISASIGVLLVMLASLTLLPALLTTFGARVARPSRRARRRAAKAQGAQQPATRAEPARPSRRPRPVAAPAPGAAGGHVEGGSGFAGASSCSASRGRIAIVSTLVMLAIAAPAMALRLGSSDASNDPASQTTHRAYELLAEGFGQGFNGPLLVVAKVPSHSGRRRRGSGVLPKASKCRQQGCVRVEQLRAAIAATPGVVAVAPAKLNPAGDVATITVYPQLLTPGVRHHPARRTPARQRRPPLDGGHRHDRLCRRRDRRRGRLRHHARGTSCRCSSASSCCSARCC